MYVKDFNTWNTVKQRIHGDDRSITMRAGEIRWVSLGVNVGSEIDGKGVSFTRPALVVHVIGAHLALVIPMSTTTKEVPGHYPLFFKEQWVTLCFSQMKVISQKRVYSRLGKLSNEKLQYLKIVAKRFFDL
jgi:mRNA interferase MazF